MKTKSLEDYYNKYMYYYKIKNNLDMNILDFSTANPVALVNWKLSYKENDGVIPAWLTEGSVPAKTRKVINPCKEQHA